MREKHHIEMLLKNGTVELRCIDKKSKVYLRKPEAKRVPVIWSGQYSEYEPLKIAITLAIRSGWDVYNTINPTKLPPTNAELQPFKRTTKDVDIIRLNTIFFDFDPVRETGTAATDDQVRDSVMQADNLSDYLTSEGWSSPVIGFSGNGCHLMYRTEIDIEHARSLKGLYAGLGKRFTTDTVDFDVTVKNPARIARTYGSINHKCNRKTSCSSTEETTHSDIILKTITKLTPPKPKSTWVKIEGEEQKAGKYVKNWDIIGAFSRAGLYLSPTSEHGKHFVTCINEKNHSSTSPTDTVIYEGEWAQYHCSHNSCVDIKISDVIGALS